MQTLIAHAGVCELVPSQVEAATSRVERHYAQRWRSAPSFRSARTENAGVLLWNAPSTRSLWPAWSCAAATTVVSIYAPVGLERVVGWAPLEESPLLLARALAGAPHRILDLGAPFVLAALDAEERSLDLFTDALGVGRLFEVRTDGGWVWSNRPAAALRFAGVTASADPRGWAHSAVADQFFGSVTPFAGVRTIDAATRIHWDGRARNRHVSVIDTTPSWASATRDVDTAELVEQAAEGLRRAAQSIGRLFAGPPVVDLSGGRDSRVVAAAFVASGTDVVLSSHDAASEDLRTAQQLVDLLRSPVEHVVQRRPVDGGTANAGWPALDVARRWHAYAEGMRPCSFLAHTPPQHLDAQNRLVIGGAGGEIAHGFYYPPDVETLEELPLEQMLREFARRVVARHAPVPAASQPARAIVEGQVAGMLEDIASWGITDATVLDHFYLRERLRRWGSTGERSGVVSPLLDRSFMVAALALRREQRAANTLHRGIIRVLLPAWADVPFFPSEVPRSPVAASGTAGASSAVVTRRLADSADREDIERLLADTAAWADAFDVQRVHDLWHASADGTTTAAEEAVLRRALWRGAFEDHLADVREEPRPVHPPASVLPRSAPVAPAPPRRASRGLRARPTVKRLAHSAAWGAVRDTAVGRAVRRALR